MIRYFLIRSIKNFFDHISLNAVSAGIISIIFIIFAVYLLILSNLNSTFGRFANNIRITIYLNTNISKEKATTFKKILNNLDEIKSIHEYSKLDSLKQFKTIFKNDNLNFNNLDNPFPISLAIEPTQIMSYSEIVLLVKKIKSLPNYNNLVNEIDFGSKWLEKTLQAFKAFKKAGLFFLAILFSGLFMIVFNTKKLILVSRKSELEVIKIMGATNTFITIPFLIEAFLLGAISSTASLLILYFFWAYLKTEIFKISFLFSGFSFFNIFEISLFLLFGIAMVIFSAFLSIHNFLKDIR